MMQLAVTSSLVSVRLTFFAGKLAVGLQPTSVLGVLCFVGLLGSKLLA